MKAHGNARPFDRPITRTAYRFIFEGGDPGGALTVSCSTDHGAGLPTGNHGGINTTPTCRSTTRFRRRRRRRHYGTSHRRNDFDLDEPRRDALHASGVA